MQKIVLFVALAASAVTVTCPTGPAELSRNGGGIAFPMDAPQYAKFAERIKSMAHHVLVVKNPAGLSSTDRASTARVTKALASPQ